MFLGLNLGIPAGGGIIKTILERLQDLGTLSFYKDYATSQANADADYSVGSGTATVTSARSASAPATYVDSSGNIQLLTTANVLRNCSGFYDFNGFVAAYGFMAEPASTNMLQGSYFSQTFATYWRAAGTATVANSTDIANKYLGGNVGKAVCTAQNSGIITAVAKKPTFVNGTTYTVSALVSGSGTAKCYFRTDSMGSATYGAVATLSSSPVLITFTTAATFSEVGSIGVVSNDASSTIYIHTIQCEAMGHHTSFIPTTNAALTRPSEVLSYPIASNRAAENETMVVKFTPMYKFSEDLSTQRTLLSTDTKVRYLYKAASTSKGSAQTKTNASDSASSGTDNAMPMKSGYSYVCSGVTFGGTDATNSRMYVNGVDVGYDTVNFTVPLWGTNFYVGCHNNGASQAGCIISAVAIYSSALGASENLLLANILSYTNRISVSGYFGTSGAPTPFLAINYPSAQYVSSVGKTFITYQGQDYHPYLITYDHTLDSWSSPYRFGTSTAVRDNHGAPCMLVDQNGYIHVFYGSHGGPVKYSRSNNPYDITSYSNKTSPASDVTYPEVLQFSTGTIYLFYRNSGDHLADIVYKTSSDGGDTWSSENIVLSFTSPTWCYYCQIVKGYGDTIHCGFIWKDEDNTLGATGEEASNRYNIYYIKYDGTKWVNGNGTDLTSLMPLDHTELDTAGNNIRIVNSGTVKCQIPAVGFDSNDYPYLLYLTGNTTSYQHKIAYWDGAAWQIKTCTGLTTSNLASYYALQINSSSSITAYITGPGSTVSLGDVTNDFKGGNFEVWDSVDTGTSWTRRDVIECQTLEFNFAVPVLNSNSDIRVLFSEAIEPEVLDYTAKLYAYGDNGLVPNTSI